MKTKAIRLYGKEDLRLEEFELPAIANDEILAKVVTDSLCMSSYKAAKQGSDHKRVPDDCDKNPIIIGHEFCGEIVEVGSQYADRFKAGQKFVIQPALNYKGSLDAPGYSFKYIGGNATYVIIPAVVMIQDCLMDYSGDSFFLGSLAEPVSCVAGSFHSNYHTKQGVYQHEMGIKPNGNMLIAAGCGPMGLCAIQYALAADVRPSVLVVTDIDDVRLSRAEKFLSKEYAKKQGVDLHYLNTSGKDSFERLMALTNNNGYDDVFVLAPVTPLVEQADALLARDGCLNFFAGPSDTTFSAKMNFYNVHYANTHIAAASGGNNDDLREVLAMMSDGRINPSFMITHIGGLNAVAEATLNLPQIPGGKKLIYTHKDLPLTAIEDFEKVGQTDPLFKELAKLCPEGLFTKQAEDYLLENAKNI